MTDLRGAVPLVEAGLPPGRSRRHRWPGWLSLFLVALVAVLLGRLVPGGVPRAVLTLPPLLTLPGFALLSLVLGRSRPRDPARLAVFSIVLSFAVMMAVALVIDALGVALTAVSLGLGVLLSTGLVTGAAIAAGVPVALPVPPPAGADGLDGAPHRRLRTRLLAAVAAVAAGVAIVSLVAAGMPAPASGGFSALSLGPGWAVRGGPTAASPGQRISIPVVATVSRSAAGPSLLTATVDGAVASTRTVSFARRTTYRGQVSVIAPAGPSLHRVVVTLTPSGQRPGGRDQVIVYLRNGT